ncbi:sporulation protein YunB [Bacillus sp. V3B]|uniref:sporulation protein YunB n=1 Tax=Bacillus sp. V3B TaxID=2804915 RepID=UPI00210DAEF6|nr:sporulation protein YunB [Bacillus sp. V3B]MCQ6276554.1 sporulation protein YunB [Bacillus sp. V3B]
MAKFRRRLLKKGPLPLRYVLLLTFVFFIFSTAAGLWIINKKLEPTLMSVAKSETINLATLVINDAIDQQFKQAESEDLFRSIPNTEGSNNIQFDTEKIIRKQTEIVTLIQKNIKEVEGGLISTLQSHSDVQIEKDKTKKSDGVAYSVPLGRITNNSLLANFGPDIPVEFSAIGDVQSDVKTKVVEFGINGGVIEVYMEVKVNIEIIIPLATDTTVVTRNIPIGMGVFRGDVPQFYNGGGTTSPAIQLPKD